MAPQMLVKHSPVSHLHPTPPLVFKVRVSLSNPGCPGVQNPPASACPVLGWKVCIITTGFMLPRHFPAGSRCLETRLTFIVLCLNSVPVLKLGWARAANRASEWEGGQPESVSVAVPTHPV